MRAWEGWTSDGSYGVRIPGAVLQEINRICLAAATVETGGILIGHYSADLRIAIVTEATPPPPDSRAGRTWFHRGTSGLREMLAGKWRAKDRQHYIGEWHFHPVPTVVPSTDDFSQMKGISRSAQYRCREPLLVIAGAPGPNEDRAICAFVCPTAVSPIQLFAAVDGTVQGDLNRD